MKLNPNKPALPESFTFFTVGNTVSDPWCRGYRREWRHYNNSKRKTLRTHRDGSKK